MPGAALSRRDHQGGLRFYNPHMIIKVYGEFWNRSRVDWGGSALPGIRVGKRHCDICNQSGIYAL